MEREQSGGPVAAITARFHSVYSRRRTRPKRRDAWFFLIVVNTLVGPLLRSPTVRSAEATRGLVELPECQVRGRTGRVAPSSWNPCCFTSCGSRWEIDIENGEYTRNVDSSRMVLCGHAPVSTNVALT